MKVREIMSTDVQRISSSAMVSEAAEKMRVFNIGCLPILEDNKIVGMLTDRDIVIRAIAAGSNPRMTIIKDIFTPNIIRCYEDDDIETAATIMEVHRVRRLVVIRNDNSVAGILSLGDLASKANIDHLTYEIMERVCEPVRG